MEARESTILSSRAARIAEIDRLLAQQSPEQAERLELRQRAWIVLHVQPYYL
jgi:hypothetical protein